jgi:hypothetical protein
LIQNTFKYCEPEKTTGPSGVEWSWFQCSIQKSNLNGNRGF